VGIHVHDRAARKFISTVAGRQGRQAGRQLGWLVGRQSRQRIKARHDRRNIFAHTFFSPGARLYNPGR